MYQVINILYLKVRERSDAQNDFVEMDNNLWFVGAVFYYARSALHSRSCEIYHRLRGEYLWDDIYVRVSTVCGMWTYEWYTTIIIQLYVILWTIGGGSLGVGIALWSMGLSRILIFPSIKFVLFTRLAFFSTYTCFLQPCFYSQIKNVLFVYKCKEGIF